MVAWASGAVCVYVCATKMYMGYITCGAQCINHLTVWMLPFNPVLYNWRHISNKT